MRSIRSVKKFNIYTFNIGESCIDITGKYGTISIKVPNFVILIAKNKYFFKSKSHLYLFRALLLNAIDRVIQVHFKKLTLKGIGFKCYRMTDKLLLLKLGFTHKIYYLLNSTEVQYACKKGRLLVYGKNLNEIHNAVYEIKNMRKPDAYKGKGIIFSEEKLKLKSSKKRL